MGRNDYVISKMSLHNALEKSRRLSSPAPIRSRRGRPPSLLPRLPSNATANPVAEQIPQSARFPMQRCMHSDIRSKTAAGAGRAGRRGRASSRCVPCCRSVCCRCAGPWPGVCSWPQRSCMRGGGAQGGREGLNPSKRWHLKSAALPGVRGCFVATAYLQAYRAKWMGCRVRVWVWVGVWVGGCMGMHACACGRAGEGAQPIDVDSNPPRQHRTRRQRKQLPLWPWL